MNPARYRHLWGFGRWVVWSCLCGVLAACQANLPRIEAVLDPNSLWVREDIELAGLPVLMLRKPGVGPVRIYIEGDGNAFTAQGRPSPNPSPQTPVALELAQADTTGQPIVYLGRPCQWVNLSAVCVPMVWTMQRFTPTLVDAYTQQIAQLAQGAPAELVGFSGGAFLGYAAALKLPNITTFTSVAGNLNPNLINRHHRVTELEVATLPPLQHPLQVRMLWGERDRVIPPVLATTMAHAVVAGCKESQILAQISHVKGWAALWPAQVGQGVACTAQ